MPRPINYTVRGTKLGRSLHREELIWAAGLFDGEGNVNFNVRNRNGYIHRQIQISVTQRWDSEAIERFWESVGLVGKIGHYKDDWIWRTHGFERVQFVIVLLWPWLCTPKKEQYVQEITAWKKSLDKKHTAGIME